MGKQTISYVWPWLNVYRKKSLRRQKEEETEQKQEPQVEAEKTQSSDMKASGLVLNPPIYFCPENVVCFLPLLHIFMCTSEYLHFHCESLNEPLHLRCGSYLHEQIDLSHTHIRAI